jgi:hypothetical protein
MTSRAQLATRDGRAGEPQTLKRSQRHFVLPIALLRWLQTQIGSVFGLGFYVLTGRTQGSCFTRGAI